MAEYPKVWILGTGIHKVTTDQVLYRVEQWLRSRGKPKIICTPNADLIMKARKDSAFQQILNDADLSIPDGMAVIRASRIIGTPLEETVNGRQLAEDLCRLAAARGWSVYFLGGNPGAAELSSQRMSERYKGLRVAGHSCPRFGFVHGDKEDKKAVQAVREAAPDILLVALGAPKQEKWLALHMEELQVPVSIGIGYAFDILGGLIQEPPTWMTNMGFEWSYRLWIEPRRLWRRYLWEGAAFVVLVLRSGLHSRYAKNQREEKGQGSGLP